MMVELVKTNFSAGEIGPELMGRSDLKLYQNGAKTLENIFVLPTGGVTRRHGLVYVGGITETGVTKVRLIPFERNGETFLLILAGSYLIIFRDGVYTATLANPFASNQVYQVSWVQSNDQLLLVHPSVTPKILSYNGSTWTITEWMFDSDSTGRVHQPYYKFAKSITLAPSAITGSITLTASAALFTANHVNVRFRLNGKEVMITAVSSPTSATATVYETLTGTGATNDWQEAVFSPARGWPRMVAFHQDRLIIGGSRDLPNRLFMSKTGAMWNFDLGTGLDDEAIEFSILSDQQNDIQGLFSSRHLLVFTASGEWLASGSPLTPGTLQLVRQSRVGSRTDYFVPLQDVDGATYFISRDGRQLREMFYNDVDGAYNATDLAATARHMVVDAIDQAYDPINRLLHVVLADGTLSTLTIYRTEGINAWSRQITDGLFKAVRTIGDKVYVVVERNGALNIERFDANAYLDAATLYSVASPQTGWFALSWLIGRTIKVIIDDIIRDDEYVMSDYSGYILTDTEGYKFHGGLNYTSRIEPLPPSQINFAGAKAMRLIDLTLRLYKSAWLTLDTGNGARDIPLSGDTLPAAYISLPRVTKDVQVRCTGWVKDLTKPQWSIVQSKPQPFTLLSVTSSMKVSS